MAWYDVFLGGMGASTNPSDYKITSPYGSQITGMINSGVQGIDQRQTPQAQQNSPYAAMQMQQAQQLQRIASGQQQGAGELAAQRQAQNAMAGQQAMARMAHGGNAALAARGAANNAAGIGLAGAGMSQQAALQDQSAAQQALTGAMGQARGQDQQMQLANLDAQLRAMGMNDQARLGYLQQLTGLNAQQLAAQSQAMQTAVGQQGLLGPLLSAGGQVGAAAAMSDERVKTGVTDARDEVDEMLDQLLPKAYAYKDQSKHGVGRRVGIMAQDMMRSRAGARVVFQHPDGLALDVNKALSAALASSARLNERLRKVERKAR